MNAPLDSATKAEVLQPLIEEAKIRNGIGRFYLRNAHTKNGIPYREDDYYSSLSAISQISRQGEQSRQTQTQPTPQPQSQPAPQSQSTASEPVKDDKWKKALAGLAIASGLGGAGLAGWALNKPDQSQQTETRPDDQRWQSPYQYLEDEGEHLP